MRAIRAAAYPAALPAVGEAEEAAVVEVEDPAMQER